MVQIRVTPHGPPEFMVSLVNYVERVEQSWGNVNRLSEKKKWSKGFAAKV